MSALCTCEACPACIAARAQRVEIRDGWVYVDGARTRPAQPASDGPSTGYSAKGGRATRGRERRRR